MFANGFAFAALGLIFGVVIGAGLGGLKATVICALFGAISGYLAGLIYDLNNKFHILRREFNALKERPPTTAATATQAVEENIPEPETRPEAFFGNAPASTDTGAAAETITAPAPETEAEPVAVNRSSAGWTPADSKTDHPQPPGWISEVENFVRRFFTDGNVVVRPAQK